MIQEKMADILKKTRETLGLSQKDMAATLGVESLYYYRKYENGSLPVPDELWPKIRRMQFSQQDFSKKEEPEIARLDEMSEVKAREKVKRDMRRYINRMPKELASISYVFYRMNRKQIKVPPAEFIEQVAGEVASKILLEFAKLFDRGRK